MMTKDLFILSQGEMTPIENKVNFNNVCYMPFKEDFERIYEGFLLVIAYLCNNSFHHFL